MRRSFKRLVIILAIVLAAPAAMAHPRAPDPVFATVPSGPETGFIQVQSGYAESGGSYFTRVFTGRDSLTSLPLGIAALAIILVVAFRTVRNLLRRRAADTTTSPD